MARTHGGTLTAEQVLPGHPDKVADQISDAILDEHLKEDPTARVAVETLVTTDTVVISGEVTSTATVNYEQVARDTIRKIGYTAANGYDPDSVDVALHLSAQSPEIAAGVDVGGAGDQGIVFGYATNETPNFMPAPHAIATDLAQTLQYRIAEYPGLGPDGKTQVTVEYDEEGKPRKVTEVVVAIQHSPDMPLGEVRELVRDEAIYPALSASRLGFRNLSAHINSAGAWTKGGPATDTGLTGRKIIADTYGGSARHGGGAFSGKDPSKVDRSAAYAARQAARWLVELGLADEAEIQIAYAIGWAYPVSLRVDTHGTAHGLNDETLAALVSDVWDMRPQAIINRLGLQRPIYLETATLGAFGKADAPWEQSLLADRLAA